MCKLFNHTDFFFFHFCTNCNFYHISAAIIFISSVHFRGNRFFAQMNALNWQTLGNIRLITTVLRQSGASESKSTFEAIKAFNVHLDRAVFSSEFICQSMLL